MLPWKQSRNIVKLMNYVYMVHIDKPATNSHLLYRKIAHLRSAFMSDIAILTPKYKHTHKQCTYPEALHSMPAAIMHCILSEQQLVPLANDSIQLG